MFKVGDKVLSYGNEKFEVHAVFPECHIEGTSNGHGLDNMLVKSVKEGKVYAVHETDMKPIPIKVRMAYNPSTNQLIQLNETSCVEANMGWIVKEVEFSVK